MARHRVRTGAAARRGGRTGGPLPEASVRVLGAALSTALGQLHRSDVVHRDLKPSNIMVTAYGPKVIDFGIARAIGDDRLTSTGAAVGGGDKPGSGPSGKKTRNLDDLWMGTYSNTVDFIPLAPFMVADLALIPWGNTDAVDPQTGERRWQTRESGVTSGIAVDGDKAYQLISAPMSDHQDKPWPLQIASIGLAKGDVSEPIVRLSDVNGALDGTQHLCAANGVVFVAGGQGKFLFDGFRASQTWALHAIDLGTGKRLWSKPLPSRPDKSRRLHFLTARVIGRGLVALQETNAGKVRVVVRDVGTGALAWDRPFDDAVADLVRLPLATDNEHVYLGSGPLQALRLSDGKQLWSSESDRPGKAYGPPSVKDGVLYAVEDQRGLVAANARDGRQLWRERGDDGESADLACRPVIGSKYVYYRNGVLLRAIDVSSHGVALTYVTVGKRFYEHERANVILAFGDKQAEAFPLR